MAITGTSDVASTLAASASPAGSTRDAHATTRTVTNVKCARLMREEYARGETMGSGQPRARLLGAAVRTYSRTIGVPESPDRASRLARLSRLTTSPFASRIPPMLVPCPFCRRHVRASEIVCPFCRDRLPSDQSTRVIPSATQRLGRSATFVFASSIAIAGCASTPSTGDGAADVVGSDTNGQQDVGVDVPIAPLYGAPPDVVVADRPTPSDTPMATDGGARDVVNDEGGAMALYGGAPVDIQPTDAVDDATGADVGRRDTGGIGPLYGAPPSDA